MTQVPPLAFTLMCTPLLHVHIQTYVHTFILTDMLVTLF